MLNRPTKRLFDEGQFAVINNVGYPNPHRLHFRSMDIRHKIDLHSVYASVLDDCFKLKHQCILGTSFKSLDRARRGSQKSVKHSCTAMLDASVVDCANAGGTLIVVKLASDRMYRRWVIGSCTVNLGAVRTVFVKHYTLFVTRDKPNNE